MSKKVEELCNSIKQCGQALYQQIVKAYNGLKKYRDNLTETLTENIAGAKSKIDEKWKSICKWFHEKWNYVFKSSNKSSNDCHEVIGKSGKEEVIYNYGDTSYDDLANILLPLLKRFLKAVQSIFHLAKQASMQTRYCFVLDHAIIKVDLDNFSSLIGDFAQIISNDPAVRTMIFEFVKTLKNVFFNN